MHNIYEIENFPTVIERRHESCYRAYHILDIIEALLEARTPQDVVSELLRQMRGLPGKEV